MIETGKEIRKKLFYYKNELFTFYFDPILYSKLPKQIFKNSVLIPDSKYLRKKITLVSEPENTSIIKSVNKIWDIGWYILLTFSFDDHEESIPWENISSINPTVLDLIEISHLKFKIDE